MEVVQDMEVFENDIEFYFQEFCEKYNISDMEKESQNRFNAAMIYIGKKLFKGTDLLKNNPNINNKYNINKLMYVLNIYIELCYIYSKEISISGYSKLTSIDYSTIELWNDPSSDGFNIYKKLIDENEKSNSDLLSTNPRTLGIIARLNRVHSWNLPGVSKEVSNKQLVARENIQEIGANKQVLLPEID